MRGLSSRPDRGLAGARQGDEPSPGALLGDVAHRVLDIAGRRAFHYRSVYFDTPTLAGYHRHASGRRRRARVRTRSYLDSGECLVEVKREGLRGATDERRAPHPCADRSRLTGPARAFVAHQPEVPVSEGDRVPTVVTECLRSTLLDPAGDNRTTIDRRLRVGSGDPGPPERHGPATLAFVETKSVGPLTDIDRRLWSIRISPLSLSRYCVGAAPCSPRRCRPTRGTGCCAGTSDGRPTGPGSVRGVGHNDPMSGAIVGADGLARCPWAAGDPVNLVYHDTEWGCPVDGESAYFERLTLEAFQSGLSWLTILNKRDSFRAAFAGFDADLVAAYDDADRARLMADAGIVRNRLKVDAAITNARATVALRDTGGLQALVEGFRPEVQPAPRTTEEVVTTSPESVALSKALKRHGFTFVGPTTMHALMEALGLVDDHLVDCHRRGARL